MKRVLALALAALLTACSSTNGVKIADGTRTIEHTKPTKVEVPEWYLQVPREERAIYAVASEMSSDMQFSIDRAIMSATRDIAFKLNNEVSQKFRDYTAETGNGETGTITRDTERMSISNSNFVNIVGVERVRTEVYREGNRFRSYVLVRYGLDMSNQLHANYMANQRKIEARERLDKYEKELRDEKKPMSRVEPVVINKENTALLGPQISDPTVRETVLRAYNDPNAVILKETIR